MRKVFALLAAVLLSVIVWAQSPQKMSYQAVIRNSSSVLVTNTKIGMEINIRQGSETGAIVYTEIQTPTTNDNGLVSIEIGGGNGFDAISWGTDSYFIETKAAIALPLTTYTIVGVSQLLSVPFALYAANSGTSGPAGADGLSAYQLAVNNGFIGTEAEWLTSLEGTNGTNGTNGADGLTTSVNGITQIAGTITLTKANIDLANVDNTSDTNKPISTATQTALNSKVDKDGTKILSTNDYTDADATKVSNTSGINTGDNATNSQYSALVTNATHTGDVTGSDALTISNKVTMTATAPVTLSGDPTVISTGAVAISINPATTSAAGSLSAADKAKLDVYPAGTTAGQMLYWNGAAWETVAPGVEGQGLYFCYGVPSWGPCPVTVTSPTGNIWMNRNLGSTAIATSSTHIASYGDLYQWGRSADEHQIRVSGTTSTLSPDDVPVHGNFVLASGAPYDWRSPQNDLLWQGVSGVNNPCPTGFRIPTDAEWNAERLSWGSNNAAGAYASVLKLPLAGYRNNTDGLLVDVGILGAYWSSTISGLSSRYLRFTGSTAGMFDGRRAFGFSVRCIEDY